MIETKITYDGQATTIANWLLNQVAIEAEVSRDSLSVEDRFDQLPIDSISLATIADQLEKWSGHAVNPTVFWEFETPKEISEWLAAQ